MALKTLNTLIKLHKRRIEIMRREMIAMEEERRQLRELAENLREEHAKEMRLSAEEPKMAGFFGAYAKRVKERQEAIAKEIQRLDSNIEAKADSIREEFSEQKKYEIAREHTKKRLAEEARHRQQQRFDEIGAQQYLRAQDAKEDLL
jgi:hypothetical protein